MPISDYSEHDGVALGQMVAKGEVTPLELVDAAIDRIERHNGALNLITLRYRLATVAVKAARTPFTAVATRIET